MKTANKQEALILGEKIVQSMAKTLSIIGNKQFALNCAIGLCAISEASPSPQELLARAYGACCDAKQRPERIAVYEHQKVDSVHRQIINQNIITHIQQALVNGEFQLRYQPIVSLHGDNKEMYEVLVRMLDDEDSFLRPDEFLPAANHAGLLNKIDKWIIMHATKILAEHRLQGHNSYLFVMLAAASLRDKSLLPWISGALKSFRLPSDAIVFQLNERDAATHLQEAKAFTAGLKELHCQTALSHFGSGLNSLKLLRQLSIDYVKLDGLFTQDLQDNSIEAKDALSSLIRSIHAQGKLAIVPMVEEARIMPLLWQSGANFLQGYFLSPPTESMSYNFEGHLEELH